MRRTEEGSHCVDNVLRWPSGGRGGNICRKGRNERSPPRGHRRHKSGFIGFDAAKKRGKRIGRAQLASLAERNNIKCAF